MKAAIISFGHVDSVITLAKYLSKSIKVDLYILLSQTSRRESILDFRNIEVNNGLLHDYITDRILSDKIKEYIGNNFKIYFFIYETFKTLNSKCVFFSCKFARIVKNNKYDLVHFNGNNFQQLLISFFAPHTPKVHTIHDYIGHSGERKFLAELINIFLFKSNRYKILHSKWSLLQAQQLRGINEKKVIVIPYSILEIYKKWENPLLKEESNTIIFFGRISPYKGIEYLIEAVPMIKKEINDLKVILAGEGKYYFDIDYLKEDKIYQIINRYIPNKELTELIQKSTIVVCPYTDATQSGVIMTAYAFNKPVVATNVGGIPEIVDDGVTGLLVPPRNSQKLAETITDLLRNPEKRNKMAENIRKKVNEGKFSWDLIAKETIEVYKKTIRQK
ncbi:MAG: glycosyltransferase family 4 protein [Candidatus Omnitrophota bacterium]|nr:glycosyltransferase family 4 protein [Candidatus Omnitrophota bacterium]